MKYRVETENTSMELETQRNREPGVIYLSAEREEERLGYWLQQYRIKSECYDELKEQLARINCDYHSLKTKFLNMREECGAEKKRATAAEEREHKIKDVLEDIIYASTYSTDVTFEEIGKAKEICKSIYGELSYEKGNR